MSFNSKPIVQTNTYWPNYSIWTTKVADKNE